MRVDRTGLPIGEAIPAFGVLSGLGGMDVTRPLMFRCGGLGKELIDMLFRGLIGESSSEGVAGCAIILGGLFDEIRRGVAGSSELFRRLVTDDFLLSVWGRAGRAEVGGCEAL